MHPETTLPLRPFVDQRRVTALGLGLAALGRPGYINLGHAEDTRDGRSVEAMRERAFAVLDAAWSCGVRHFDTARSYGRGEAFLGDWLRKRQIPGEMVTVASKWGYTYTADWRVDAERHEVKDHSLPVLQRQWQETQTNLGGYLSLYQIHSATLDSGVLADFAVHVELARFKAAISAVYGQTTSPRAAVRARRRSAAQGLAERLRCGHGRFVNTPQAAH